MATKSNLNRVIPILKPLKWTAFVACALLMFRIGAEVAAVYFLSPIVTTVSEHFTTDSHAESFWSWFLGTSLAATNLRNVLGWMVVTQTILGVLVYLNSIWETKLSVGIITRMRSAVYDHLQYLGFSFYDRMSTGNIMSRALFDVGQVHNFIHTTLMSALDCVVSVSAYAALLAWRSPWLLLTALIPVPIWYVVISRFSRKSGPLYYHQQVARDQLVNVITENVNGKQLIRAVGAAEIENQKFSKANATYFQKLLDVIRWNAILNPALQSLAILAHITVFIVCSFLIQRDVLPVGDLLILGAAMGTILGKLRQVHSIAENYQRARVSSERLQEIFGMKRSDIPTIVIRPADYQGDIVFENVSFKYHTGPHVLKNISCRIPGRQVTALIGPTASGKTTLSMLIGRFYEPESGRITVSGIPIEKLDLTELRHKVGFVFQETFLFSDTIKNNILYGRRDVDDEMLYAASRAAHADDFIQQLPQGYETLIGEGGVQLSGGQRQRLSIARALVYNPEILILDDAFAALDPVTAQGILTQLEPVFKNRTVLFISHRLSALKIAQHVITLDEGTTGTELESPQSEAPL